MELIKLFQVEIGDILEGPDGPSLVTSIDRHGGRINSTGNHCMLVTSKEKIVRYVSAKVLRQAGLKV